MNNLPTNYANYKILAGLVWGDRKNYEETERKKVNNADEKTATSYAVLENASNLVYANVTEKAKSTSLLNTVYS